MLRCRHIPHFECVLFVVVSESCCWKLLEVLVNLEDVSVQNVEDVESGDAH
jgi:hypothetical protein